MSWKSYEAKAPLFSHRLKGMKMEFGRDESDQKISFLSCGSLNEIFGILRFSFRFLGIWLNY